MQKTIYSIGFLFDEARNRVVLIEKNRPVWQAGYLNGVGGHVEPGETPCATMVREFYEEAGVRIIGWHEFCVLNFPHAKLHVFRSFALDPLVNRVRSMTDEIVQIYGVFTLPELKTVPNLQWLVPMALSMDSDRAESFVVDEVHADAMGPKSWTPTESLAIY